MAVDFEAAEEPVRAADVLGSGEALALAYGGAVEAGAAVACRALDIAESAGVPSALALAHYGLAEVAAEHHARQALRLAAPVESRFALGIVGVTLATLLSRTGRTIEACAHYRDVVGAFHRSGTWTPQWVALRTLVDLLERAGNPRGAALLLGAVTASPTAAPVYGADAALLEAVRVRLEADLGAEGAALLIAAGAAQGDDAAIGHAVRALDAVLEAAGVMTRPASSPVG